MKVLLAAAVGILFIIILLYGNMHSDYREKTLADTLTVPLREITRLEMVLPSKADSIRSTTSKAEIQEFVAYFNHFHYQRLMGDEAAYMPMEDVMVVYLHGEKGKDFLIPYVTGIMISQKVYQVKEGEIAEAFLLKFYHDLE